MKGRREVKNDDNHAPQSGSKVVCLLTDFYLCLSDNNLIDLLCIDPLCRHLPPARRASHCMRQPGFRPVRTFFWMFGPC